MYPCGNCRAVAVGPDGRCAACGTYQQQLQQPSAPLQTPQTPGGYPAAPPMGMPAGGVDLRRGLSTTLIVLFGVALPALIFVLVGRGDQYGVIADMVDSGWATDHALKDLEDADDVYTTGAVLYFFIMVAIAVVWAIWFRRLRLNAEVFAPGRHRFGSGWAAGAWFTPVVNLWFPKQIANDIWRASSPGGPHEVRRGLLNAWWVTWIVAAVANAIGTIRYNALRAKTDDHLMSYAEAKSNLGELRDILAVEVFATVVLIAAAVLALLLVRQITAMQERRASLPPQLAGPAPYGMPAPNPYGAPSPGAAPYGAPAPGSAPYGAPQMPPTPPTPPPGRPGQQPPPYGQG
ncbi:DUF4328 domain-containing protein [Streptomyces hygroscopicus subsp. hygroscopicus]|uniref:DUF4328 domain-containing protein n=2 Tax=Streptomyces TaxID=1883 RepID=A0ABT9KLQ6_9ACTN|nr:MULTISPECIES: DUF4328 domain-containing protein [Streptomyces]MBW8087654.1 DUF4328 domain-containing protein [Streptomyces hygroscopicus subsp. hygroscopicus]MDN3056785.1 DUF4328 domain-containing protein [Streptomyces sp. SRF1]MDP9609373.1 hypothetical protein [Streptomyces demainii]GHJ27589.1 hypothetical protein TPA0910_20220 [Streptomyces hygroscopicus]